MSTLTVWKILLLWMLPCYRAEVEETYECGAHGKFEYCIDGIPGCVVGCHCHPGYYFDTESKICEPNSKLIQSYRRNYMPEPTRIQNPPFRSNVAQTEPTPTAQNTIEEQVNDITKNADDLGDWLYNQFFKTIENQVINKTSKSNQPTRRSERRSMPKHKRRDRRKGKKQKKSKKGIQEKLLRIAEDDSLFHSSDSSSYESSSPEFLSTESSSESENDESHGHKKIILINKKPRPPLPSFIFLPNMNTPYYPPIGLPPPPAMPMYPMVPVPPMLPAPPVMPYPGHEPECDEHTTTKPEATSVTKVATDTTSEPTTTEAVVTVETEAETVSVINDANETDSTSTDAAVLRNRFKNRKRKRIKPQENFPNYEEELLSNIYDPSRENRQKLLKLLRQRIHHPRIDSSSLKKPKKPFDHDTDQLIPPDTLNMNDFMDDAIMKDNPRPAYSGKNPELENVDFKYLSQLIHRVNDNQTQDAPTNHYNPQNSPKTMIPDKYHDFSVPLDSARRIYHEREMNTSRNRPTDDTYYSNLGRQIATLIRTIDADKKRQFNIEIEKVQEKTNEHPYFNENGPRTFWERSVRSPFTLFRSRKNNFDNKQSSNELLYNIENKVEVVASTVPTLGLDELENLINVMQTARTKFQSKTRLKNVKPLNKTLNINLWPRKSRKVNKTPNNRNVINVQRRKGENYYNIRNETLKTKPKNISTNNPYPNTNGLKQKNKDVYIKRAFQIQPSLHSFEKWGRIRNPTIVKYKNMRKYFFDANNQYSFQNDELPPKYSSVTTNQQLGPLVSSPIFHHEINHIDYIS